MRDNDYANTWRKTMSEHENELKRALAENGNFDAEKARRLGAETITRLRRGLIWRERLARLLVILCLAIVLGNLEVVLLYDTSTKAIVLHAVVAVIVYAAAIEIAVLLGINRSRVSLLKEIKLLRLDGLYRSTGADVPATLESVVSSATDGPSWWERATWLAVTLSVVGGFCYWGYRTEPGLRPSSLRIETYITLASDGAGTEVMKVSYPYMGFVPRSSFPFATSDTSASIRWVDGQGRQLPATFSTSNGQRRYTVRLIEPVMPGEQVHYTQITESSALATEKDGLWMCRTSIAFGDSDNGPKPRASQLVAALPTPAADVKEPQANFSETIQLPKGAEVVTADPQPVMWGTCIWGSVPARGFQATRGRNDAFTCAIQYRLPKENSPSKTAK
jgi:hypothetical protein